MERILILLGARVESLNISFLVEIGEEVSVLVEPAKFTQAMLNFCLNSLQAIQGQQKMGKKENHKIVFTGHSLGAALSTLAAVYTACRLPKQINILNIHFGSPRVGNDGFKSFVQNNVTNCAIWRCVYEDDIVTKVPPTPFLGYQHIGNYVKFDRKDGGIAYAFRNDDNIGAKPLTLSDAKQSASDSKFVGPNQLASSGATQLASDSKYIP